MKLTYKQAEDRIFKAYFNDEIKPLDSQFCFCGTLAPNFGWRDVLEHVIEKFPFTLQEYIRMEKALFFAFGEDLMLQDNGVVEEFLNDKQKRQKYYNDRNDLPLENFIDNYEDKIFQGMCNALEVLKDIYIQRGEIVDFQLLKKRELVLV